MMTQKQMTLEQRIESGKPILIAAIAPPTDADTEVVRRSAKLYAGKVHALGVNDNLGDVRMAALAASTLVAAEGVEPILHVVTRDRNRIALLSECLGAHALGIRNILCTSGLHVTQGHFAHTKKVYDVDSVQLLQMVSDLEVNGSGGVESLCLGAVASPYADPVEMQVMQLVKKVTAGAKFIITQPVFDHERFMIWSEEVARRNLGEEVAILAGVKPLTSAQQAVTLAGGHSSPKISRSILERISAKTDKNAQRAEGIAIAAETIERLSGVKSLRGFGILGDGDDEVAVEVIDKSGLRLN